MLGISLSDSSYLHTPLLVDLCNLVNMLVVGVLNLKKKKNKKKQRALPSKEYISKAQVLVLAPLLVVAFHIAAQI